jgi:hypothetical protein
MAIIDIYRKGGGRTGGRTQDEATATEQWYVGTDVVEEVETILAEFVQPGGIYQGRRVASLSAAEHDDGYSWLVDIGYSTTATDPTENPLTDPVKVSGSQSARQVPIEFDKDGNPILNTAGDPFQEILFAEDFDDTLQLTFNRAVVPFSAAQSAKRTTNSTPILGLAIGTVRYAGMSFQPQEHDVVGPYYSITIGLALAADWKKRILNQGFRELDNGELKPIKKGGKDVSQPVLLAIDGTALPENGTPVTLEKDIYGDADYVALFGLS